MARAHLILLFVIAAHVPRLAAAETFEIRGNVALPSDVYRSAVVLSDLARTKTATVPKRRARQVARSVLDFLLASGYDLAAVDHHREEKRLVITVDEGRLDQIIFLRQGTLRTLQLKFMIQLPGNVFNRPLLQQQLDQIVAETDVEKATFRLVPVERVVHAGLQLEDPGILQGFDLLKPGGRYAVHVYLTRPERTDGTRLGLGISSPDGFYGKVALDGSNLVLDGDRINAELRVGFHTDNDIDSPSNPVGLSRLRAAVELHSPPFGEAVTSYLALDANMYGRRRPDLGVANFYYLPLEASLNVAVQATEALKVALGIGVAERLLFGIDPVDAAVAPLVEATERADLRMFVAGELTLELDRDRLRLDRPHRVRLGGQFLGAGSIIRANVITKLRVAYENMWALGFDEFHVGAFGYHVFGAAKFYDELSIGDGFLRAVFGSDIYLRRGLGVAFEYRISVSRDVLKVSIFDDVALYGGLDKDREKIGARLATTFGMGLHVLILDAFQLNAYGGLGLASGREIGFGLALSVQRAY